MKDDYLRILKWAHNKKIFSEKELFTRFNDIDRNWYLNTFRGGTNNDECLIKICDYKNNEHYCCLSAKGLSEYQKISKNWWEKPLGIILTLISSIILAYIVYKLGWNN